MGMKHKGIEIKEFILVFLGGIVTTVVLGSVGGGRWFFPIFYGVTVVVMYYFASFFAEFISNEKQIPKKVIASIIMTLFGIGIPALSAGIIHSYTVDYCKLGIFYSEIECKISIMQDELRSDYGAYDDIDY